MTYDIRNLTKEEAISLHREMWTDMANYEKKLGRKLKSSEKNKFKENWCKRFNNLVLNDCFLCEYAQQQLEKSEKTYVTFDEDNKRCLFCPLYWGDKIEVLLDDGVLCENNDFDWRKSDALEVATLQEKEFVDETVTLNINMAYIYTGTTSIQIPKALLEGKSEEEKLDIAYKFASKRIDDIPVAKNTEYVPNSDNFEIDDVYFLE